LVGDRRRADAANGGSHGGDRALTFDDLMNLPDVVCPSCSECGGVVVVFFPQGIELRCLGCGHNSDTGNDPNG
jgi:hypothetical protein